MKWMRKHMDNQLAVENDLRQAELSLEDQNTLHKIHKVISTCEVTEAEVESIRRDLIGMAAEAKQKGTTLKETVGTDVKQFCNELVYAATGKEMPEGRSFLRYGGGVLKAAAVVNLAVLIWIIFIVIYYGYSSQVTLLQITGIRDGKVWLFFLYTAVENLALFAAGQYGFSHCANRSSAKRCCFIGGALLVWVFLQIVTTDTFQMFSMICGSIYVMAVVSYFAGACLNRYGRKTKKKQAEELK